MSADWCNETQLLDAAQAGNERAFLQIYQLYRAPLFRFAWRLTTSQPAAEDIVQECFAVLLESRSFDNSRGTLRTYLFGIIRNLVSRRFRLLEREADPVDEAPAPVNPLSDLLNAERSALVANAVAVLPPLQREALILFQYEGLSLEEIATITESDAGAIKSRLHRARESLRHLLAPLLQPGVERKSS